LSENRVVLSRIFEPKTEEEMGGKSQNEKYHNLCFSLIVIIKEIHAIFLSEYLTDEIS
jgi:hypothetical protein